MSVMGERHQPDLDLCTEYTEARAGQRINL